MATGSNPRPKPWETAATSSGPAPFKPPSGGSTSEVVEASGTARHGEVGGSETKLYFKSSDGVLFELDKGVAMKAAPKSFVLDSVIEDNSTGCIPVLGFNCDVLDKVIEYCYKEARCAPKPSFDREEIKIWNSSFFKVGSDMHYNLIMLQREDSGSAAATIPLMVTRTSLLELVDQHASLDQQEKEVWQSKNHLHF